MCPSIFSTAVQTSANYCQAAYENSALKPDRTQDGCEKSPGSSYYDQYSHLHNKIVMLPFATYISPTVLVENVCMIRIKRTSANIAYESPMTIPTKQKPYICIASVLCFDNI